MWVAVKAGMHAYRKTYRQMHVETYKQAVTECMKTDSKLRYSTLRVNGKWKLYVRTWLPFLLLRLLFLFLFLLLLLSITMLFFLLFVLSFLLQLSISLPSFLHYSPADEFS